MSQSRLVIPGFKRNAECDLFLITAAVCLPVSKILPDKDPDWMRQTWPRAARVISNSHSNSRFQRWNDHISVFQQTQPALHTKLIHPLKHTHVQSNKHNCGFPLVLPPTPKATSESVLINLKCHKPYSPRARWKAQSWQAVVNLTVTFG